MCFYVHSSCSLQVVINLCIVRNPLECQQHYHSFIIMLFIFSEFTLARVFRVYLPRLLHVLSYFCIMNHPLECHPNYHSFDYNASYLF